MNILPLIALKVIKSILFKLSLYTPFASLGNKNMTRQHYPFKLKKKIFNRSKIRKIL